MRLDSLFTSREVASDPRHNSRGSPSFQLQFERYSEFLATTKEEPRVSTKSQDEGQFPCFDTRGIPRSPLKRERRHDSPEATWAVSREPHYNSRGILRYSSKLEKNPRFPPQLQMRPDSTAATQEETPVPHCNSKTGLTHLRQQDRLLQIPVYTWEEARTSRRKWRKTMRFTPHHEMRPSSPAGPRDQPWVPSLNLKGGLTPFMKLMRSRYPSQLLRSIEFPSATQD